MNKRIQQLIEQAGMTLDQPQPYGKLYGVEMDGYLESEDDYFQRNLSATRVFFNGGLEKFAELIVEECVDKIETYRIPVGNSAAGELACEWTYDALKEIRDDIKEHFGVE